MLMPVSEAVFLVCDQLGAAYQAGVPLPLDAHATAAEQLREAAQAVRGMERVLNERVAEAWREQLPPLRLATDGGREV